LASQGKNTLARKAMIFRKRNHSSAKEVLGFRFYTRMKGRQ
jgi:hypothetical protein